jgi:hypothetical protein
MDNKCVYVHKLDGEIVYVGSGHKRRVTAKCHRSDYHLKIWDKLEKEILFDNLSAGDSRNIEQELINNYWDSGKLLNIKKIVAKSRDILYDYFCDQLEYDETSSSCLRWKKPSKQSFKKTGDVAGYLAGKYYTFKFKGEQWLAHRVIWALSNKKDLDGDLIIDHIDRDSKNNKASNLRAVTQSDNLKNKISVQSNTGERCISERFDKSYFIVNHTQGFKRIQKRFSYSPSHKRKNSSSRYKSREIALAAAIEYRNGLVKDNLITLTP